MVFPREVYNFVKKIFPRLNESKQNQTVMKFRWTCFATTLNIDVIKNMGNYEWINTFLYYSQLLICSDQ